MRTNIIKKWHKIDIEEFSSPAGTYNETLYQERSWLDELLPAESLDDGDLAFMYRYGQ